MKRTLLAIIFAATLCNAFGQQTITIDEVIVDGYSKETNRLRQQPSGVSMMLSGKLIDYKIQTIKDLSAIVPNLYMPTYGSKMSNPIYLRGVGTRSGGSSVGVYVDGIPYMNPSTCDFELMDIQRIDVLRGPQGTLYGRNSMAGVINIQTRSPLYHHGTRLSIGGGNYGLYSLRAAHATSLADNVGLSISGYYDKSDGYFTNAFTGKKTDDEKSAGVRLKLDWQARADTFIRFESAFDYTDQGAFPYGLFDKANGKIGDVNFNDEGSYRRSMLNNTLRVERILSTMKLTSSTGYQYLDDDMRMDQDFTEKSIFTINQLQRQHSYNQEFTARSRGNGRYQWSFGLFGFYNHTNTTGDVAFGEDGVSTMLQPIFDNINMGPGMSLHIDSKTIPNPGTYKTPTAGAALYHQSTYNITPALSVTAGLRLDYEKQWIDYSTSMAIMTTISGIPGSTPTMPFEIKKEMTGKLNQDFTQLLPKLAMIYEFDNRQIVYANVSKGYKAGGYNNQMFSEVIQGELKNARPGPPVPGISDEDLAKVIAYKPEQSWSYEVGTRGRFFNRKLDADIAIFYMDIDDMQLTQFVTGGSGRVLSNAGSGRTYGAEIALTFHATSNLRFDATYGYTNSKFINYDGGEKNGVKYDYSDNYTPYTPTNTMSIGASYKILLPHRFIDQITLAANYTGTGKIYWTEKNDITQPFYGLLNGKVTFNHKRVSLDIWGKNLTSKEYGAFYFESFSKAFIQKGRPLTFGANLSIAF